MSDKRDWANELREGLVHGTPGEDTSKNKGDQPSNGMFHINEDSHCSVNAQEKLQESFNMMMEEMKALHADDSEYTSEDYINECDKLIQECYSTLKSNSSELNESLSDKDKTDAKRDLWDLQSDYKNDKSNKEVTPVAFQKIDKVWYFDYVSSKDINHRVYIDKLGNIQNIDMDTNKATKIK